MSNVKLAIRIRPFTERELKSDKDRTRVLNVVDENTVTITNIKVSVSGAGDSRERVRRYYADYTFDSACSAADPEYASQEKVFNSVGLEVVSNVQSGSSACVLAYGQSATGKTHTMMGTDAQPGLVPRLCKALAQQPIQISVSFLEIYNERVHDLLVGEAPTTCHSLPRRRGNARKDLRVREHPSKGPYVQNLRRVAVTDVETLLSLVSEGTRRRRTAATKRNSTSSRSHALLELATPNATLHLADLAGSENASWEGCGGGRQKEGANINKSLVALSNVISALVSGGSRGRFVPYRDSALTWLLKDCFTGGASTFIIATLSPSVACYGESASTLRWAARARQLPTQRVAICSQHTISKAALQAQFNQLLAELARHYIRYIPETGCITFEDQHWTLNKINVVCDVPKAVGNIGNIMNLFNTKAESQNSESTASSIASGSSEVLNIMDKNINIKDEISKEVDKLLSTNLERTKSGSEIEVTAPLRKRRQYKSQEVLPNDKNVSLPQGSKLTPSQSQEKIGKTCDSDIVKPQVPIYYDNQRAEIVASVTERLYSRLKKKEEAVVSKMESAVDKKIIEPLNELRICTNARQRLMELSQRAMRHKRRIGIPAHTQTRPTVTRVKDQGTDVQTDLDTYIKLNKSRSCILQRDVATETVPMISRCKEIGVGSQYGTLRFSDRSTLTDKPVTRKNSFMMTDAILTLDRSTQTPIVPPPRRKRRCLGNKVVKSNECCEIYTEDCNVASIISINISQPYLVDSETQSSDENSNEINLPRETTTTMTPDLLANHNSCDASVQANKISQQKSNDTENITIEAKDNVSSNLGVALGSNNEDEFPNTDDFSLPRVSIEPKKGKCNEIKDMILGRNENMFPYNIILSPPRERDTKRIVQFKSVDAVQTTSSASQTVWEREGKTEDNNFNDGLSNSDVESDNNIDSHVSVSDSTECSKVDTDSFIWQRGDKISYSKTMPNGKRTYTPVYKNNPRHKTLKQRTEREFLKLHDVSSAKPSFGNIKDYNLSSSDSTDPDRRSQTRFKQRRPSIKGRYNLNDDRRHIHKCKETFDSLELNILDSCVSLEASVDKYDNYLRSYRDTDKYNVNISADDSTVRTPTEYLQHLIQLRREVVRADCDAIIYTTDSSSGLYRDFF